MKRTYNPSFLVFKRRSGFLKKLRTSEGRSIINRRIKKGRKVI